MPDDQPRLTTSTGNGGLYFLVGALVVVVLVGTYVLLGAPGMNHQVANAPGQKIDITVEQPRAPAPPAPVAPTRPAPEQPR